MFAMDSIYCRSATFTDLPEILNIEKICYSNPWNMDHFRDEFISPFSLVTVICIGNIITGYAAAALIFDELQIRNICISPDFRRKGLGEKLLNFLIDRARSENAKMVLLEVRESNIAAINLYTKTGFHIDCKRKGFYSDGETGLAMSLKLPSP
jgi:ribosomal-protein-alanine N-acetyltransferase